MINSKSKHKTYLEKLSICSKEASIMGNIGKELTALSRDSSLWNVEWKGYNFSIRPFLCSALSFMHSHDIADVISSLVNVGDEEFYHNFMDITREEYYGMFSDDENAVFSSVLYQLDSYIPAIARYLVGVSNPKVVSKIFTTLLKDLSSLKPSDELYVDFTDSNICNTEAFSYHLVYHWLFQKSQKLRLNYLKELRILNLEDALDKLCPVDSIHFKYISGEITAQELKDAYLVGDKDHDVYPVRYIELVNLVGSEGYDSGIHDNFLDKYITHIKFYNGYEDFYTAMCNSYFAMGYYKKDSNVALFNIDTISDLESSVEGYKKENRALKSKVKNLTKSVKELRLDLSRMESESDSSNSSNDRILELMKEVSSLKSHIVDLESDLDCKCNEISEYKHSMRTKIKEIKSLSARIDELKESIKDNEPFMGSEEVCDEKVSLEEMVESLRGYKLGIFGGFGIGDLSKILGDYGLTVKHFTGETNFIIGELDCAVVLTSSAKHKVYRRLKSQHSGSLIHVNNLNIEKIIEECYKELCERREAVVEN